MDAINYVIKLKTNYVSIQNFEMAYYLRGIENKFNGSFGEKYLESNYDNLINSISNIITTQTMIEENRMNFISIIRDIKIKRLINEL